jgi:hypothetical protein
MSHKADSLADKHLFSPTTLGNSIRVSCLFIFLSLISSVPGTNDRGILASEYLAQARA